MENGGAELRKTIGRQQNSPTRVRYRCHLWPFSLCAILHCEDRTLDLTLYRKHIVILAMPLAHMNCRGIFFWPYVSSVKKIGWIRCQSKSKVKDNIMEQTKKNAIKPSGADVTSLSPIYKDPSPHLVITRFQLHTFQICWAYLLIFLSYWWKPNKVTSHLVPDMFSSLVSPDV